MRVYAIELRHHAGPDKHCRQQHRHPGVATAPVLTAQSLLSRIEAIANPRFGEDVAGVGEFRLDLLS